MQQKVITHLWFDKEAEAAMNFYVEVFKGAPSQSFNASEVVRVTPYPGGFTEGPMAGMAGKVLNGEFKLGGVTFYCLDGGKQEFNFNEAVSLYVGCQDQAEIDYFYEKLSAVPEAEICGWCKDKYGLSWQIIPNDMEKMMTNKKAMEAMLKMKKIIIADLQAAK
ncbi:MAG TPA: VOC family protein [Candidatus Saccharimonadales bacterium]|nr:VOC family protein [Candidatus Saccharimonadales bacterium]